MTKRTLDRETLLHLLAAAGVTATRARAWERLPGGTYNTLYRVELDDGMRLLLKLPPAPGTPAMAYETGLLRGEAEFYREAALHTPVPVPEVVCVDEEGSEIPGGFLLMTERPGVPWDQVEPFDPPRARRELGRMAAELHGVTGRRFGYPAAPLAPAEDWPGTFATMLDAVLADAAHHGARLPADPALVRSLADAAAPALAEVTVPALVHFDLWRGNVLVTGDTITGVIDGERMFWGDPLAEFASLNLLGGPEDDIDLLTGYRDGGGRTDFDDAARQRMALYRCYLYLIMLTEGHPRAYPPEHLAWAYNTAGAALLSALDTLTKLAG